MSLIGVDVGSSSVKAAAYGPQGRPLAHAVEDILSSYQDGGRWETDPESVWQGFSRATATLMSSPMLQDSPPRALAVSASGREVFPTNRGGLPIGVCIRTADTRGDSIAADTLAHRPDGGWIESCGFMPGRMDPVNRILWWRQEQPDVFRDTQRFLDWHSFVTARLTGTPAVDHSLAGKTLAYDLDQQGWSEGTLSELGVEPDLFPPLCKWGDVIGHVTNAAAGETGLPEGLSVAAGAFDVSCAAIGSGTAEPGQVGLTLGSWLSMVTPIHQRVSPKVPTQACGPHPSETGLGLFAMNPRGTAMLEWARRLIGFDWEEIEITAARGARGPSPIVTLLDGSADDRSRLGTLSFSGVSLDTDRLDIVQSLAETITYELVAEIDDLSQVSGRPRTIQATGGGAASSWMCQLGADLLGIPVEVREGSRFAGTAGAAVLAGFAVGAFPTILEGSLRLSGKVAAVYEPRPDVANRYGPRIQSMIDARSHDNEVTR